MVYSTSKNFMDYFGINSADDLPKIKEVLAEQLVEPTIVKDAAATDEEVSGENDTDAEGEAMAVTEQGELVESKEQGDEE